MRLQRVGCPDTEDSTRGRHQRTGNDHNQEDIDEPVSLKRREPSTIGSFRETALLVELTGTVLFAP